MRKLLAASAAALAGGLWMLRGRSKNTGPNVQSPGERKKPDTVALEIGAALFQSRSPLSAMNLYLNGFHFYADDMGRQMEAHHYCTQVNEDLIQCVIFDGNMRDARLIGIEYIVGENLFRQLPEEEKRLWHSHRYEVKSGTLIAPGIPDFAEHRLMEKIVNTYGKVWHTWDTGQHDLPVGIPALMMGFTADGQMKPELNEERDRRFRISSMEMRRKRRDIPMPRRVPGADAWEAGRTAQLKLEELEMPGLRRVAGRER